MEIIPRGPLDELKGTIRVITTLNEIQKLVLLSGLKFIPDDKVRFKFSVTNKTYHLPKYNCL